MVRSLFKNVMHAVFSLGQRLGVSILPVHFYSSIPNVRELRSRSDWKRPRSMYGINSLPSEQQIAMLNKMLLSYPLDLVTYRDAMKANGAGGYGPIESQVLAAFVAAHKPKRLSKLAVE